VFRVLIAVGLLVAPSARADEAFDLQRRKQRHPWIWTTPSRQELPDVAKRGWVRDDLDAFILSRLERDGLSPAGPAAPGIWLRRAHFAITGLPPTPEQLDSFAAAPSSDARARVVDELLASPHFAERWARHWLDVVRYAESRGHESDFIIANAYHYRDYLIRALSADVPYDAFVLEHLAGDLLESPRLDPSTGGNDSILATGWPFFGEEVHSPVDIRQDECDRTDNKVDVLGKAFLGLTIACARCHDHKFDPISQKDYYALCGFILSSSYRQVRFETIEHHRRIAKELSKLTDTTRSAMGRTLGKSLGRAVSSMPAYLEAAREGLVDGTPTPDIAAAGKLDPDVLQRWIDHLADARDDVNDPLHAFAVLCSNRDADDPRKLAASLRAVTGKWAQQRDDAATSLEGFRIVADYSSPDTPWIQDGFAFGARAQRPGDLLIGAAEGGGPVTGVATSGAAVKDPFWDGLHTAAGNENDSGSLGATARSGRMIRTPKFELGSSRLFYLSSGKARVYAGVDSHLMITGPLHGHLLQTVDGPLRWNPHDVRVSDGQRAHVEFGAEPGKPFELRKVVEGPTTPELVEPPNGLLLDALTTTAATSPGDVAARIAKLLAATAQRLAQGGIPGSPDAVDHARFADWIVRHGALLSIDRGETRAALTRLARTYHARRNALAGRIEKASRTAVAWLDGDGVDERLLERGSPRRAASTVPRALPVAFEQAGPISGRGSGRLELARRIANPENPLTARVVVNRVWHHLFGRGIVASVDNFGFLGSRPSHPGLLDHLAWRFVHEDGWSIKRLVRRLVLSSTYGMSSRPDDPRADELDPDNVLLHRMPVRRLEAEAIRDSTLTISGRLDRRLLGPPVPVHLTEFVIGRGRPGKSGPLDGNGRRSIYTAVRRNFLPTLMITFDVPIPFSGVGRRNVTNVPAQSLALMNDPLLYQQAGVWARRLLEEHRDGSHAARIDALYRTAFGRAPQDAERRSCETAVERIAESHRTGPDDLRVWTDLCHSLFSVNDFIYIR